MATIRISCGNDLIDCDLVIIVPERALNEPGYIRAATAVGGGQDKHALHALAQTASYRYQDDELQVAELWGTCHIALSDGEELLTAGMVIYRELSGAIKAAAHSGLNVRRLLDTADRYCTRWVRLDL